MVLIIQSCMKLSQKMPKTKLQQPKSHRYPTKLLARHGQPATPVPPDRPSEKEIGRNNGRFWQKDSSSCEENTVRVGMGWILASRDGISTDHIESTRTWRGRYVDTLFATICDHFDILNSIIINLSCCLREHL
jgi:hypothetical protein